MDFAKFNFEFAKMQPANEDEEIKGLGSSSSFLLSLFHVALIKEKKKSRTQIGGRQHKGSFWNIPSFTMSIEKKGKSKEAALTCGAKQWYEEVSAQCAKCGKHVFCVEHSKVRTETSGKNVYTCPECWRFQTLLLWSLHTSGSRLYTNLEECTLNRSCVVLSDRNFSLFSHCRDSFLWWLWE